MTNAAHVSAVHSNAGLGGEKSRGARKHRSTAGAGVNKDAAIKKAAGAAVKP